MEYECAFSDCECAYCLGDMDEQLEQWGREMGDNEETASGE